MNTRILVGLTALAAGSGTVLADFPQVVLGVRATQGDETAMWMQQFDRGWLDEDGNFDWHLSSLEPISLTSSSGRSLGQIDNLWMQYIVDPEVNLQFAVVAGGADTTFEIFSGVLTFPTLPAPTGNATADVTITDFNFNGDVTMTGENPGGGIYQAFYNDVGTPGTGTSFTELLTSTVSDTDSNGSEDDADSIGSTAIGTPVFSMSSKFHFTLSAGDLASGSSFYQIIPTPGAMALIAFGGGAALRRRR